MKIWFDNGFSLIKNTILIAIAVWFVITPIFENITIDSMLARFAVSLACIGNLFSKHQKFEILFFYHCIYIDSYRYFYLYTKMN